MQALMQDSRSSDSAALREENSELRRQLEEASEALEAIRTGQVDALIVERGDGEQVFTLKSADHPYRIMVEQMTEGAATLGEDGTILYCNRRFAEMLGLPLERAMGTKLTDFLEESERPHFLMLLQTCGGDGRRREFALHRHGGATIPRKSRGERARGRGSAALQFAGDGFDGAATRRRAARQQSRER